MIADQLEADVSSQRVRANEKKEALAREALAVASVTNSSSNLQTLTLRANMFEEIAKAKQKRQQDAVELDDKRLELGEDKAELRVRRAYGQPVVELESRVAKDQVKVDQAKLQTLRDQINLAKEAAESALSLAQQRQQQEGGG